MKRSGHGFRSGGFTLLELLVATAIFMVICGAMFGLLQISQEKYVAETQMSGSFQEARLGLDQIVRDIDAAGYPPVSMFSNLTNPLNFAQVPFAWGPNYPLTDCQIGSTCSPTPSDYDLIVETNTGSGMVWIRYQLNQAQGVLYRGVVPKTTGDPVSAFSGSGIMTPLVTNVLNYPTTAQLAQINTQYSTMLPAGTQPIFVYSCSTPAPAPAGSQPCASAGAFNAPKFIIDIDVTLIVRTPQQDMQTQSLKLIELTGRGHQTNYSLN